MSKHRRTVIKGGDVVTPFSRTRADIVVEDGVIQAIGMDLPTTGADVLSVDGMLVLPGAIDVHTHMALPMKGTTSCDDFFTGSAAAACGGVTTIIDFTELAEGRTLATAFKRRLATARGRCAVDFGLHACLRGWSRATAEQIPRLVEQGVTSFKMFTVYRERGMMSEDGDIFEALQATARHGAMVTVHAENAGLVDAYTRRVLARGDRGPAALAESRPNVAEGEAIQRMATLTEAAGGRCYIVHCSTKEGLRALELAQGRGVNIVGETCPQYLVLSSDKLEGRHGQRFTCVPPLRSPLDNLVLWQGLEEGRLAVVATDHCPFTKAQKDAHATDFTSIPLGLPGVETLLPLLFTHGVGTGRLTVNQLVQVVAANPAMLFGLYPRKGILQPGSDADIVVFDPHKRVTLGARRLHMATDYSPYEGMRLVGYPVLTMLGGKVIVRHGRFVGAAGDGRYLVRTPEGV